MLLFKRLLDCVEALRMRMEPVIIPGAKDGAYEGGSREPAPDPDPLPGPRRRILFVERDYPREIGDSRYRFILTGLREGYEVIVSRDLSLDTAWLVRQAAQRSPFDAVVTHVPYDTGEPVGMFGPGYSRSLRVLEEIRKVGTIPIIAYTGAEGLHSSAMWNYIDRKVCKSNDYQRDLARIRECLRTLIREAAEPFAIPLPQIDRGDGNTTVVARVNRRSGLGMPEIYRICDECMKYPGTVTIQRLEPLAAPSLADARNPMELMLIELIEGSRALVTVEGTDATAEHLAKRLYGRLTARYGYQISVGDSDNSKETQQVQRCPMPDEPFVCLCRRHLMKSS